MDRRAFIVIILILFILSLFVLWDLTNFSIDKPFLNQFDYHNIDVYFGALMTGLITFFAMYVIDDQNKKRWEKEYFQKRRTELILETITCLANCLGILKYNKEEKYSPIISEFTNSNDNFKKGFKKRFIELWLECGNSLSKLNVFYKEESESHKKNSEIRAKSDLLYQIFNDIFKQNCLNTNSTEVSVNIINSISNNYNEYIQENYESFEKLLYSFCEQAGDLHEKLTNECSKYF